MSTLFLSLFLLLVIIGYSLSMSIKFVNIDSKKEGGETHNTPQRDEGVGGIEMRRIQRREQKQKEIFEKELREEDEREIEEKLREGGKREKEYEEKVRVRQEQELKRKVEGIERKEGKEIMLREVETQYPIVPCMEMDIKLPKGVISSLNSPSFFIKSFVLILSENVFHLHLLF